MWGKKTAPWNSWNMKNTASPLDCDDLFNLFTCLFPLLNWKLCSGVLLMAIHWPPLADHQIPGTQEPLQMFQCNSSMQNWEPLDFKVPKVEGREKKGKNKKLSMVYQQQNHAHLWDAVTITLPMPSLCNIKVHHVRPSVKIPTTQKWKLPL